MILGLSGSLRSGSFNNQLLRASAASFPTGVDFEIFDDLAAVPPYVEDAPTPIAVDRLRQRITAADAILIATPEYNASIPGQLKNALDWISRPFPGNALRDCPVAVIGASTGLFGAIWAQAELRKVLATIGACVVDAELPVGMAHEAFAADGTLIDAEVHTRLAGIVEQLLSSIPCLASAK